MGKSSISASLAVMLSKNYKIVAADCDVDAPNLALVLGVKKLKSKKDISTNEKARLIFKKCISCKQCLNTCVFSAISWDKTENIPVFDRFLCEGCGNCALVCPEKAIELYKVKNATVSESKTKYGFPIVIGQLKMGESGSGKIVTEVKDIAEQIGRKTNADFIVVDAAPGIGCPVIASIRESDYVIAVTEPTPSGLADLKRVLRVVEHFKIQYALIINKYDINPKITKKIETFAKKKKINIITKLPYDKAFVEALVNLTPIVEYDRRFENQFEIIKKHIEALFYE